uniref:AAA+ ATPase domain-containing protein n=1 Tax=Chromera velia CCMP2878 TaxID=1169474 RepID=A0A0G4HU76_9ALVE|eukprot:Cvel_8612.t1-p1 / transcript=Cvel_8612.t1 / gene=Cvel_8612 / organism=Chromera_velia_CCMP2878 / gene_product=Cell division cycle protein 48 homolog AF_1297, putative / transcript_product=Cell division cycle protein 48 homolog AF_1297, putative / location=Cvel_scaffold478:73811-85402(-) / protein_length=1241 / sequence_SO=supercontig / SO=protein_coding / is_pseudo=false
MSDHLEGDGSGAGAGAVAVPDESLVFTVESMKECFPEEIRKAFSVDRTTPFETDFQFFRLMEAVEWLKIRQKHVKKNTAKLALAELLNLKRVPKYATNAQSLIQGLESLGVELEEIMKDKLKAQEETGKLPPRLVRLEKKYELEGQEARMFRFCICVQASELIEHLIGQSHMHPGMLYTGGPSHRSQNSGMSLSNLLSVPPEAVLIFFGSQRKHVKDGLFHHLASISNSWTRPPDSVMNALLGFPLSASQFLEISQQAVVDVVSEEPSFAQSAAGKGKLQLQAGGTSPLEGGEGKDGDATDAVLGGLAALQRQQSGERQVDLFKILGQEVQREKTARQEAQAGGKGGQTDGEGIGGGPLPPPMGMQMPPGMPAFAVAAAVPPGVPPPDMTGIEPAPPAVSDLKAKEGQGVDVERTVAGTKAEEQGGEGLRGLKSIDDLERGEEDGEEGKKKGEGAEGEEESETLKEYKTDLEFLQDSFHVVNLMVRVAGLRRLLESSQNASGTDEEEGQEEWDYDGMGGFGGLPMGGRAPPRDRKNIEQKRRADEASASQKLRALQKKQESRLQLTAAKSKGSWQPRLQRLCVALRLSTFERCVILSLVGSAIAPEQMSFLRHGGMMMGMGSPRGGRRTSGMSVGTLLSLFCASLDEQIRSRRFFYKSATLIREGVVSLNQPVFTGDLLEASVEVDRRLLDFVVGLDTEFSELVEGSHLYAPTTSIADVVLPEDQKNLVIETVSSFDNFKLAQKNLELEKKMSYGTGMTLLFWGPSGTGKTMLANALASRLGKKILLINFPNLGDNSAGAIVKMVFREAKINDAVVFFDECEAIFMTRERFPMAVNTVLTELERHDGLSILATNRPHDLDEAMHRRITLAVEFKKPDHLLRERIWGALRPPKLRLSDNVNLPELALQYELTGGFIKNAWLSALNFAVAREGVDPVVSHADLKKGAAHQLRGSLSLVDFDRRVVPTRGIEDVILPKDLRERLLEIVSFEKSQAILYGQWGFSKQHGDTKGTAALFHGPPGTGKTMAAEAIGYDLGKPLKMVNVGQLMSKWVGETGKNIEAVFNEAKAVGAVLVFDEAEGLFGARQQDTGASSGRHDTLNVGLLLHHIETFAGVTIVVTNFVQAIDSAFLRRFKFVLEFPQPDAQLRGRLWRLLLPAETPTAPDVNFEDLGRRFDFSGGSIKSAIFRAAARAALRKEPSERLIKMADLTAAAEEEVKKDHGKRNEAAMRSMFCLIYGCLVQCV